MMMAALDLNTMTYIQSETEFCRALRKGFWELLRSLVTRHENRLLCFNEVVTRLPVGQPVNRGLQDIAVKSIVGSSGRATDFTSHFMPVGGDDASKERWRNVYTRAVTGAGFPPVELYQVGPWDFVQNGHHRVSVANYLGWKTIQAYVTEMPLPAGHNLNARFLNTLH